MLYAGNQNSRMESKIALSIPGADRAPEIAKLIIDLDAVVQSMLKTMPISKPWQRQLLTHLADADRCLQVLRMMIAMDRGQEEMLDAVARVHGTLRSANLYVLGGRADIGTKTAVHVAFELGRKLSAMFSG